MSQQNPVKDIIRGSAYATVAAVLVPVQVWLYKFAEFDARSIAMILVAGVQLVSLALSITTLAGIQRQLKKK